MIEDSLLDGKMGYLLPLIRVPVVCSRVNLFSFESCHQLIVVVHPHGTANNFSNTRHETVHALRNQWLVLILLHVESFDLPGEVAKEYWAIDDVGIRLSAASAISSPNLCSSPSSLGIPCSASHLIASEYFMRLNGPSGIANSGLSSMTYLAMVGSDIVISTTRQITSSR